MTPTQIVASAWAGGLSFIAFAFTAVWMLWLYIAVGIVLLVLVIREQMHS